MKRFGGFKVAKVHREMQRGKHLVNASSSVYQSHILLGENLYIY